jgi:hypothetical protein
MKRANQNVVVDRSLSLVIDSFVFQKGQWDFRQVQGQWGVIHQVPGTWNDAHASMKQIGIFALFCCPNCKQVSALADYVHKVNHIGKISPSLICKYKGCSFHRNCYLDMWNQKPLYACAIEYYDHEGKFKTEMRYTHASTTEEARLQLGNVGYKRYNIVAIGRAIAMFVEDKKGLVLSAD